MKWVSYWRDATSEHNLRTNTIEKVPPNVPISVYEKVSSQDQMKTEGLAHTLARKM